MSQHLPFDRAAASEAQPPMPRADRETTPSGLLDRALTLMSRRRRARVARTFRGFDRHQLHDLGITPLDQW